MSSAEIIDIATKAYWETTVRGYLSAGIPASNSPWRALAEEYKHVERAGVVAAIEAFAALMIEDEEKARKAPLDEVAS